MPNLSKELGQNKKWANCENIEQGSVLAVAVTNERKFLCVKKVLFFVKREMAILYLVKRDQDTPTSFPGSPTLPAIREEEETLETRLQDPSLYHPLYYCRP